MAFTKTDRSLCNKLVTDFPSLVNPLTLAQGLIIGHTSTLDSMLRSTAWSGTSVINGGISTLNNTVGDAIPGSTTSDMQSLKNFLDNCSFMKDSNPLGAILDTSNGIFTLIDDTLSSLYTTIPEFGIGQVAGYINDLLKGGGTVGGDVLSDIFKAADKLINCLTTMCGFYDPAYIPYISSFTSQLTSLFTSMNIISDPLDLNYGLFDYQTLYADIGLLPEQIFDINLVIDSIDMIKEVSMDSLIDSLSSITELMEAGDFFTAIPDDLLNDVFPGDLF